MASAFLWDDRVPAATLASIAGTVAASMPAANLLDAQPRMRARWLGSAASILVDFGADTTLEAVALLSTSLRTANGDTVRARLGTAEGIVEAAPLFDLDLTSPDTLALPAGWAFNRASSGWRFNAAGVLVEESVDVARFDYSPATLACRGLLLEEARTSGISNPRAEGAAAGTPGTMPTNWSLSVSGGLSSSVVGTGTESGLPYLDIRVFGTTSGAATILAMFQTGPGLAAASGQAWTATAFLRLVGGAWGSPSSGPSLLIRENNSGGGALVTNTSAALSLPTAAGLATQRASYSVTLGNASTANAHSGLTLGYATGQVVDFTLRIGVPQLERGPAASSPILPPVAAPAFATRAADQARITGLSVGPATMLIQSTNTGAFNASLVVIGGWAPGNDFNNSSYFQLSAVLGVPTFAAISGGVGVSRGLSGSFGTPTTYVGATASAVVMFAANAFSSASAAAFVQPAVHDRAALGGTPWGNSSQIGIANGVGIYRRWALYPARLSDAQIVALATTGSSRTAAGLAWDSGALGVETDADALGNTSLLAPSAVVGRYLLVDVASPDAAVIDLGRLVAGPLWRPLHGFAYGAGEGREILDQRDRNPITAAEFPRPALFAPRMQRFTLPVLSNAELRTAWRSMLARLRGAGEALWIPDTSATRAEIHQRSLWGAIAAGGEEALATRDGLNANSRTFRIVERI
jgi:hypothetical protein